jgi:hypothetical protein
MSYTFSHIFIPLAILFIFADKLGLDKRHIIIFSVFGILPDFDIIFYHRATFHNIFFVLIISALIFIFMRNEEITEIILFYMSSHLILDMFNGGIVALYPLYNGTYFITMKILSGIGASSLEYIFDYGIRSDFVDHVQNEKIFGIVSSENFGTIILFLIVIGWLFIVKKRKR